MKTIALATLATVCLLGQQQTYNVQTCSAGQICTSSQVTVTPRQEIDPSIILRGTNPNYKSTEYANPAPVYRPSQPAYPAPERPKAYEWQKMGKSNEWFLHNGEMIGSILRSGKLWQWSANAQRGESASKAGAKQAVEQAIAN